jgi:hypothetical protein
MMRAPAPEPVLLTQVKSVPRKTAARRAVTADRLPFITAPMAPIKEPPSKEPKEAREPRDLKDLAHEEPIPLTQPISTSKRIRTIPGIPLPTVPELPREALREAVHRDEVAALLLSYLAQIAECSAMLVVRRGALAGYDGCGGRLELAALRRLTVPLEGHTLYADVVHSRMPYRGALPHGEVRRALAKAFGVALGEDALLLPLVVADKVVGVLYADRLSLPLPVGTLDELRREAGQAYERIIRSARKS